MNSASSTSLSRSETTAFFSSSYSPESDQSESSGLYAYLPISCKVKPALAIFLRKISASLKFLRQISLKPSLFLSVSQSLTGSMASMNLSYASENGTWACLYPIHTN